MRTVGVALALFLFVFITGCTRAVSDKANVTVQFPAGNNTATSQKIQKQAVAQNVGALTSPKWGLPVPTDVNDFNCYALFLRIPDATRSISCHDSSAEVFKVNELYGVFNSSSEISIEVTAGSDRVFGLVGFYTDDSSYCVDLGDVGKKLPAAHFSPPVLLATTKVTNLPPGNVDVSLDYPANMSVSGILEFEDCDTKPFASTTVIEAAATGVPTGNNNATTVTANVLGFNSTEYAYEISSGVTCSAGFVTNPGSWSPVGTPINYDLSANGISDGPITLCLLGRRSLTEVQSTPTVYTWSKDTALPANLSLSATSIYSTTSKPILTISGTEAGTTVKIFASSSASPSEDCNSANYLESYVVPAGQTSTNHTLITAVADGNRYFTALAVDAGGNSSSCSNQISTLIDTSLPDAPNSIGGGGTGSGVFTRTGIFTDKSPRFAWDAPADIGSGVAHYEVNIDLSTAAMNDSAWNPIGNVTNYTLNSIGFFIDNINYRISVRAVDAAGNKGGYTTLVWKNTSSNPNFLQQAYLKADYPDQNDYFGKAVAIDGDVMVVGSRYEDGNANSPSRAGVDDDSLNNTGAVYVYRRNAGGTWSQEAYLKPNNVFATMDFGYSVAISGNRIVVGAPLEDCPNNSISTAGPTTCSGTDVGAVYTFTYDGTNWNQENYIKPSTTSDYMYFGHSVSIDGNTMVVGAIGANSSKGKVYVFRWSDANGWEEEASYFPDGGASGDRFGWSVSVNQGRFAASSYHLSYETGYFEIFEDSGVEWVSSGRLISPNPATSDQFGFNVSLYGTRVAVGAYKEDSSESTIVRAVNFTTPNTSSSDRGAVYIFEKTTGWNFATYVKPSQGFTYQYFGFSVALFEDLLVVGSPAKSSNDGGIYTYKINNNYREKLFTSTSTGGYFGSSVSISNSAIAVGGYTEKFSGGGVANSPLFYTSNDGTDYGAAWVFESTPSQ